METHILLMKFFGWFLIILSPAMYLRHHHLAKMGEDMLRSPALMLMAGAYTTVFGLFLVLLHNIWAINIATIVTIFAWLILLKGIMLLYFPDKLIAFYKPLMNKMVIQFSAAIYFILGVILLVVPQF